METSIFLTQTGIWTISNKFCPPRSMRRHHAGTRKRLTFGRSILLKYLNKILDSYFKELDWCETSRLGAIPCLVSCLPQRMLHDNVKTFDVNFKKRWRKEAHGRSSWRSGIIVCLFLVRNTILNRNSPKDSARSQNY